MNQNVPAGWYSNPDQDNPGTVRWWDGEAWSDHSLTDFSHVVIKKLSKNDAREMVLELQTKVHELEDFMNRNGARKAFDYEKWITEKSRAFEEESRVQAQHLTALESNKIRLESQISLLEQSVVDMSATAELQAVGLYDFDHPAEKSATLAVELNTLRQEIKDTIRNKQATWATKNFTFNNSAAKGRKFVNDLTRLMLQAYNAEAENAIKTTKAGNLQTAQKRLARAVEQVAKNGKMIDLQITPYFHSLRLKELELANRHLQALQIEKELERERRAELREQRKAEQELKKEQARLEKEKAHYETTLKALQAQGDDEAIERMLLKIVDVDKAINDVDYRVANIRAGYVYVISNIGSFGPDVVKIGMTRRLDPMDRVRELGDASVPFKFDVHALFFAEDAVSIENMLHKEFSSVRINQVNLRREYFETTPESVLKVLKKHDVELVEYTVEPEAEEYRQSQSLRLGEDK